MKPSLASPEWVRVRGKQHLERAMVNDLLKLNRICMRSGILRIVATAFLVFPLYQANLVPGLAEEPPSGESRELSQREIIRAARNAYTRAGDDLKRKELLAQRAMELGTVAVDAIRRAALTEFDEVAGGYRVGFRRLAIAAPEKTDHAVLASDVKLSKQREYLEQLGKLINRLGTFLAEEYVLGDGLDVQPNLMEPIAGFEQETLAAAKTPPPAESVAGPAANAYTGLSNQEVELIRLTNQERKKMNLEPLVHDPKLSAAARDHSGDMVKHDFFDHESPVAGKKSFLDRAVNFKTTAAAENIALTTSGPAHVIEMWMNSPGHRANILKPELRRIGIGNAGRYWTQMFGH